MLLIFTSKMKGIIKWRWIHIRALQFIPAPTSPWIVRKHFFSRQQKYVTCQINKDINSYYIASICIYLYIIINALNGTEHAELRNRLLLNHIETFFMFQTFIKKKKTFTYKLCFTVTNSVLWEISGSVFLQTSHYIINVVTGSGIINEPRKLWLPDIVEFALSTFRTRNFITFLAWYFCGYCINKPALW